MGNWNSGEALSGSKTLSETGGGSAEHQSAAGSLLAEAHQALGSAVQFAEHHPWTTGAAVLAGTVLLGGCGKLIAGMRSAGAAEEAGTAFVRTGSGIEGMRLVPDFGYVPDTQGLLDSTFKPLADGEFPVSRLPDGVPFGYESAVPSLNPFWVRPTARIVAESKDVLPSVEERLAAVRRWGSEMNMELPD